jgi:hypothetical protein
VALLAYLPIRIKIPATKARIPNTMDGIAKAGMIATKPNRIKKMANSKKPILLVIFINTP